MTKREQEMSASNNGFNSSNPAGIAEDPSSANNDVKPVSIFSTDYKKYLLNLTPNYKFIFKLSIS